jgi:hypothetical protein
MVICDRCRSESNNSKVSIDLGVEIDQNYYSKRPSEYLKDLCHSCQQDLLNIVYNYMNTNPKEPKPKEPTKYTDQQILDEWNRQGVDGDGHLFLKGLIENVF